MKRPREKPLQGGDDHSSLLEKTVIQAWQGIPELKIDEKRRYLGTFAERVMAYLVAEQLKSSPKKIDSRISLAMDNEQAFVILVRSDYVKHLGHYIAYARKKNLKFKVVSRPDLASDIVLVVAAKQSFKK